MSKQSEEESSHLRGVALTSRMVAAARAIESRRWDRLFDDPYAALLAGDEGFRLLQLIEAGRPGAHLIPNPYVAIRTRFFDDFLLNAVRASNVRQVVILASGMDARAFRFEWPSDTKFYEIDRPEVLELKSNLLFGRETKAGKDSEELKKKSVGATCQRHAIGVDLADPSWTEALGREGYDDKTQSVWLIEGLILYLEENKVYTLFEGVGRLVTRGSLLALDIPNNAFLGSPWLQPYFLAYARIGAPLRFATDEPEELLASHGWKASVLVQVGEGAANYGRWLFPVAPRGVPGVPRVFFVKASKA